MITSRFLVIISVVPPEMLGVTFNILLRIIVGVSLDRFLPLQMHWGRARSTHALYMHTLSLAFGTGVTYDSNEKEKQT